MSLTSACNSVVESGRSTSEYASKASASASQASSDLVRLSKAKVTSLYTKECAFVIQVKEKLKRLEKYKEYDETMLQDEAVHLTDEEKLITEFSHLYDLDDVFDGSHNDADVESPREKQMANQRHGYLCQQAREFPIVLYLFQLNVKQQKSTVRDVRALSSLLCNAAWIIGADYGPVHAAIGVDDVVLEWGLESVVIPRKVSREEALEDSLLRFHADIRAHSKYHVEAAELAQDPDAIRSRSEEVRHTFTTVQAKRQAITKLVEVICRYNRKYYYNVVCRNCQGFVRDALEALGIDKPPKFQGLLAERVEQIKNGDLNIPKGFARHEDIDVYVMKKVSKKELEQLTTDDLQGILLAYIQHHDGALKCNIPTCKSIMVAELVQKRLAV